MYEVRIFMNQAVSMATMAAPAPGMGMANLPAGMPFAAGIYLIFNSATNCRYAGISSNVAQRFTSRMQTITELSFNNANMAPIWAWWGTVAVRWFPPSQTLPTAFPTMVAGFPLAGRYQFPGGAPTVCPIAMTAAAAPTTWAAENDAMFPVLHAYIAYLTYSRAIPRTPANIANRWQFLSNTAIHGLVQAAIFGAASAWAAATAVAALYLALAAPAISQAIGTAVHNGINGLAVPPPFQNAVATLLAGGYAPAAAGAVPALVVVPPVTVAGNTRVRYQFGPPGPTLDLEHVLIRFVRQHLNAGGTIANGAKTGPILWPGAAAGAALMEPICVTWDSLGGAGFNAFQRSVMWWPGTTF